MRLTEMKCPCCEGKLIYREIVSLNKMAIEIETHTWSCQDCVIIVFEYYNSDDITGLKQMIKESW